MKKFTFILQDPSDSHPTTFRFSAASIISATNTVMQDKKLQGFTIKEVYCGSKRGKITQMGFISYEYLEGKKVAVRPKAIVEPTETATFGSLLSEVDEQCGAKKITD